jgi:hypothetical protein
MGKGLSVSLAILYFIISLIMIAIYIDSSNIAYLFLSITMFSFVILNLMNAYKKSKTT